MVRIAPEAFAGRLTIRKLRRPADGTSGGAQRAAAARLPRSGAVSHDHDSADVRAAGGVVCRRDAGAPEVAVVHRPRYDDWSFPKGKLDPGETWEQAALREVEEEIGLRCALLAELAPAAYDVAAGRKVVRYWLMEPRSGAFVPNEEVDEVRWLGPGDAPALLSYEHDRGLAREVGR
jgi:8-oxo-dGTP pyrophosphatase MutT (NUDIX family)